VKVFVTKYVISGKLETVDLSQTDDLKYWSGRNGNISYFMSNKEVALSVDDARKQIQERFKNRRESLTKSLSDLDKVESSVLWQLENPTTPPVDNQKDV
jgi:hypothetical protein